MYKVYRDPEGKSEVSSPTNRLFQYNEEMYKEQIEKLNKEVVDLKRVGNNKCIVIWYIAVVHSYVHNLAR